MFRPSDLVCEYRNGIAALKISCIVLTSQLGYYTSVFQVFETGCPCAVCGHVLTTCLCMLAHYLANLLEISWFEGSIERKIVILDHVGVYIGIIPADKYILPPKYCNLCYFYFHI